MAGTELRTSDLGQAAFLLAMGHRFLGLNYAGGGRYGFQFGDEDGHTSKDADAYFAGAMAPAREVVEALKTLKQLLYAQRGRRNGNGNCKPRVPEGS
jgi:hypothetical protein